MKKSFEEWYAKHWWVGVIVFFLIILMISLGPCMVKIAKAADKNIVYGSVSDYQGSVLDYKFINSRIQFYDGEKIIIIDIEPNKVYSISSNTRTYNREFIVIPGCQVREYPNDFDCIGDPRKGQSGITLWSTEKDCIPKIYGKKW